ncbi:ABC transporter, ATP-binding protein [Paracholeplasma brassicae]|uniref:ABC transporter, ATP-binding protein n=1 Tax=Acholeplasma brassicae TaxID=61635 RepID=U4KSX4_9MOLU|nr:ABC transporter ATP-binding protein [Paracholeplasma brassicae]CCV65694.1 ABC transporter, ATP-binding protein [Paracholeplasma brassicae]
MNKRVNNTQSRGPGHGPGHGMGAVQKPKNMKKSLMKLLNSMKGYQLWLLIAFLFAGMSTVFNILGPTLLGDITNVVHLSVKEGTQIDLDKIRQIAILLIVLYLLSMIFNIIQSFILTRVTQSTVKQYRTQISRKINRLPLAYFDNKSYGEVLSIVTNDIDTIGQALNQSVSQLITSTTSIIGIVVIMITISIQLSIVSFVAIPLSFVAIMIVMKFSQKYFRSQQKSLGKINGHIEEIYSAHNVVKVFNASNKNLEKFETYNNEMEKSAYMSQFLSGLMMPITTFISNLSFLAVGVFGGILTVRGVILIGDIQSMIQYNRRVSQPLGQIAQSFNQVQSAIAASERVFEFLEQAEMKDESNLHQSVNLLEGNVTFKHVKFGYQSDKIIIKDFNLEATKGQKIAIVGPTGAGKTTLVNLIMKFYEINEGDILFDGVSIHELSREKIADLFAMVLQDAWLFKGTIYDNLTYGSKNVTQEEVIKAAQMANIHHFIESLPNGYQMILDEESGISQGQKQLFTIARAMVRNAPMLILDEATSSVDTRTEVLIQEAMDKLMHGRTTFVIAHRLSTIKNADIILVMNEGDIIESGNHETLLKQNGFYANLYNSQFEKVEQV